MLRKQGKFKAQTLVHANDVVGFGGFLGRAVGQHEREIFGCMGKCGAEAGRTSDRALFLCCLGCETK